MFRTHAQAKLPIRILSAGNHIMKIKGLSGEEGAMGYVLLWLLGIPIPILLLFFLLRGCT